MSLQLGLVGLPNVGKSTLFNALTRAGATVANYPFTTISPNVGVVPVPDPRLDRIAEIIGPDRVVPATLEVVDIAGLVKGASHGEGLGNQFLGNIRNMNAIAMVVRCFQDELVQHVTPYLNPVEDIQTIELELILADIEVMERYLEGLQTRSKGHPRDFAPRIALCERVLQILQKERSVRSLELGEEEAEWLREVALLTNKPLLYVANVAEGDLPEGGDLAQQVARYADSVGAQTIVLSAQLEAELQDWEEQEARDYLQELGLESTGLERFSQAGYDLLNYVTFFTTTGGKEVRAWNLRRGASVLEAAANIHTDMARGFIRAEVVAFDDLDTSSTLATCREKGQVHIEGRDYVVQDGDVIHIRFAV